ncbi:sigma-70 family RNA polymerase sigma factor [Piscibacillus halophilus]|uniref:RNA polymerase sigma factor, sigma-70 family n=1 Tax=Piscibacillus halophilus TaxID=571933 RepID=A0A1H9DKM7_9BACI|nr:sigma-70 family RNA polymerase sigma factor [Piscibacillus halophilus]SEQ14060.1 RNA polymerase sigma factor, sigma-70 family [Piscibacillus halophilus]
MPNMLQDQTCHFSEVLKQYESMIYHLIHKLNIQDREGEFYQQGLIALWESYQKYYDRDSFSKITYITIRSRLIDLIRKKSRLIERETVSEFFQEEAEHDASIENFDPMFWELVRGALTEKQWIYVQKRIVEGKGIKEIATEEHVTIDAVKGWGKEVKRKLRPVLKPYLT